RVQHEEERHVARATEPEHVGGRTVEDATGQVLSQRGPDAAGVVLRQRAGPVPEDEDHGAGEDGETADPDAAALELRKAGHEPYTHSPRRPLSLACKRKRCPLNVPGDRHEDRTPSDPSTRAGHPASQPPRGGTRGSADACG